MIRKLFLIFLAAGFIFLSEDVNAQLKRNAIKRNNQKIRSYRGFKRGFDKSKRYNYIGFSLNSIHYFGDISPVSNIGSTDIRSTGPSGSIWWGHRFGPRYTLRGSFTWAMLRGDDYKSADPNDSDARFRYVRNLHFRNHIKELAVTAMFDLKENNATYINRVQFTPYVFAGLAVFHHNPQAKVNEASSLPEAGSWVDLQPLGTEGQFSDLDTGDVNYGLEPYSRIQFTIPVGIGARYRLTELFDIAVEFNFRYLFTDYIDDVSGNYVDLDVLNSDLAREMSYRSDEATAAVRGDTRDLTNPNISSIVNNRLVYDGRNGNTYDVVSGFGHEQEFSWRGNSKNNDVILSLSVKLTYILGGSLHRPKFR